MARRPINAFALSFLDCICCGFGAVILVFMIISAKIQEDSSEKLEGLESNRLRLESLALAGERVLAQLRADFAQISERRALAGGIKDRLGEDVLAAEGELDLYLDAKADLEARKERLAELENLKQAAAAEIPEEDGSQARTIVSEGNRQYLTGLRMGGRHILILVDSSASMLASTIVNVIRLRYLPDDEKLRAKKWQQVVGTVDWLTANIPGNSQFQIYTFNTKATPLLDEKGRGWIDVGDGSVLDEAVDRLRKTVPTDGTSLHAAFSVVATMHPRPDNVYLLVDGLPTQGASPPKRAMVSGKERLRHFSRAIRNLPRGVPINVVLFAMEGDAYAPDSFWKLSRNTQGSFISPALDWP
ncbi:MAG: VWA domain-containing protein [Deltaproteobacteria bacterium]|jgi:hypothetical protein|nr:VWA domain-containing protein [Deltaproteobacteria bacterium]MBW2542263.1 VWA domain-containing protein [Deltaproteobacteria bacterium]